MDSQRWSAYVDEVRAGENDSQVARRLGVHSGTVGRWLRGSVPEARQVVAFARAYGRSPLQALLAAELIDPADADVNQVAAPLADMEDGDLLLELLRRHRNRIAHGTVPINQTNMAIWQANLAAEQILKMPAFPTLVEDADDEPDGQAATDPVVGSGGTLMAARAGQSRGEAVRQAQDDDGESPDASS